jgi:hypothetical protein
LAQELNYILRSSKYIYKPMTVYNEIRDKSDKKHKFILDPSNGRWYAHTYSGADKQWIKTGEFLSH